MPYLDYAASAPLRPEALAAGRSSSGSIAARASGRSGALAA